MAERQLWREILQCIDNDNRSYQNICNISFVSFSLAVIFIIYRRETISELVFLIGKPSLDTVDI